MKIKFKHVAFAGLLVAGVGLTVGAVFLPPLAPAAVACIAGAVAMTKLKKKKEAKEANANPVVQQKEDLRDDKRSDSGDELKVDVSVHHKKRSHRDSQLAFKAKNQQGDVKNDSDSEHKDQESVIRGHKL